MKKLISLMFVAIAAISFALPAKAVEDYKPIMKQEFSKIKSTLPMDCGDGVVWTDTNYDPTIPQMYFAYTVNIPGLQTPYPAEIQKVLKDAIIEAVKPSIREFGDELCYMMKKDNTKIKITFFDANTGKTGCTIVIPIKDIL